MTSQTKQSPTVFIVDDDAAIRFAMAALMDSVNLDHEIFGSADEFLEKVSDQRPGCLVLDIRMPGLDGHILAPDHEPGIFGALACGVS